VTVGFQDRPEDRKSPGQKQQTVARPSPDIKKRAGSRQTAWIEKKGPIEKLYRDNSRDDIAEEKKNSRSLTFERRPKKWVSALTLSEAH
jgi:hypothetical protein